MATKFVGGMSVVQMTLCKYTLSVCPFIPLWHPQVLNPLPCWSAQCSVFSFHVFNLPLFLSCHTIYLSIFPLSSLSSFTQNHVNSFISDLCLCWSSESRFKEQSESAAKVRHQPNELNVLSITLEFTSTFAMTCTHCWQCIWHEEREKKGNRKQETYTNLQCSLSAEGVHRGKNALALTLCYNTGNNK